MKLRLICLVAILASGCRHQERVSEPPEPEPIPPERLFSDEWVGKDEDTVILHFGKPNETSLLSNGNRVDGYHQESVLMRSRSPIARLFVGERSDSGTGYCDRRFEIDPKTRLVLRAILNGNACDM
jgi:hypothetical protein